jgi:predicted component of type VI protein secretion system
MSDEQPTQTQMPPDFGDDDVKNDDAMFVSAMPPTVDVSLSGGEDDEEENPFGQPTPARKKTSTNTTATVEPMYENKKNVFEEENIQVKVDDDDEDLFGETKANNAPPLYVPPVTPVAIPEPITPKPVMQDLNLFPTDLNAASAPVAQPVRSSNLFESQMSSSTVPKSVTSDLPVSKPSPQHKRPAEHNIEISVSDPTKVGDVRSLFFLLQNQYIFL